MFTTAKDNGQVARNTIQCSVQSARMSNIELEAVSCQQRLTPRDNALHLITSRLLMIVHVTFFSKFSLSPWDVKTISLFLVRDIVCFLDGELAIRLPLHTILTNGRVWISVSSRKLLSPIDSGFENSCFESFAFSFEFMLRTSQFDRRRLGIARTGDPTSVPFFRF